MERAVEAFERNVATSQRARQSAALARAALTPTSEVWAVLVARPGQSAAPDEGLSSALEAVARLCFAAEARGLRARRVHETSVISGAVAGWLARTHGARLAASELVAAVGIGTRSDGPLGEGPRLDAPMAPVVWMTDDARTAAAAPSEWLVAPSTEPLFESGHKAVLCDPGYADEGLIRLLVEGGLAVDRVATEVLVATARQGTSALVVACTDEPRVRAAVAQIGPGPAVLAVSRFFDADAAWAASACGASGWLTIPADPPEFTRVARAVTAKHQMARSSIPPGRVSTELLRSERLATLGWLATSVGHDLRTPLAAIRSNSQVALHALEGIARELADAPTSVARAAATVADLERTNLLAAERLAEIAAGLKTFGQLEDAETPTAFIDPAVDQVLALCAPELAHARLERSVPAGLPPAAIHHPELMHVLMNLLVNAGQAVRPGGRIELRAELVPPGGVVLVVTDDGPGIEPSVRDRVFNAGVTTKAGRGGSGLGLSIVRRIVERRAGSIAVTDVPGGGTAFRVRLPRADSV
jgi:signal transduction histidine kinase